MRPPQSDVVRAAWAARWAALAVVPLAWLHPLPKVLAGGPASTSIAEAFLLFRSTWSSGSQ